MPSSSFLAVDVVNSWSIWLGFVGLGCSRGSMKNTCSSLTQCHRWAAPETLSTPWSKACDQPHRCDMQAFSWSLVMNFRCIGRVQAWPSLLRFLWTGSHLGCLPCWVGIWCVARTSRICQACTKKELVWDVSLRPSRRAASHPHWTSSKWKRTCYAGSADRSCHPLKQQTSESGAPKIGCSPHWIEIASSLCIDFHKRVAQSTCAIAQWRKSVSLCRKICRLWVASSVSNFKWHMA